jgi:hypothetical protein
MFMINRTPTVIPRIFGGIGNQLFIYAAARRLALVNNADLALDVVSGFAYDSEYRQRYQLDHFHIPCRQATARERLEPFSRVRRNLMRRFNRRRPFAERAYLRQEGLDFDRRLLDLRPRDLLYLEGYWQSESYFKDVEVTLRQDLRIQPPSDPANQEMARRIRDSLAVAVHVRFFDDPSATDTHNNVPSGYYERSVECMEACVSGAHYYLFSDQPEAARAKIPLQDERLTLVSHNRGDEFAYADLWLMRQCRHFIIANSTFSWWGAWLGEREGTQIIAPGFEKRSGLSGWGFDGLLPERWIKL